MAYMLKKGCPVQDVLNAAKNAGRELAKNGRMNEETLRTVGRELVSLKDYVEFLNRGFQKARDREKTR